MSEAGALLHAILADAIDSETEALLHLEAALTLEVEPLAYCANRFNLNDNLVMERAAQWAGLAFAPRVPRTRPGSPIIEKLEHLGEIRSLRCQLLDREVIYTAPRFTEFLNLRRHIRQTPGLARHICVVPASAIRSELADASQAVLLDEARQRLSRKWPRATGGLDLSIWARSAFVAVVLGLVLIAALAPLVAEAAFVPLVGALLALPALLRLWAAIGPRDAPAAVPLLDHADLPRYTILLPLRDEARLVSQLSAAIRALDYPPEKLDVRFIVEARSANTVTAVQRELGDPRFELLAVPDALPRTKPKALNYALPFVIGEHVVVYDAEDIPDPGQLRLAASLFAQRPDLDCLQAELVIDNAGENWLTALFAGEYAGQFGLVLPLLARLGLPMPLGGTSNHFRTSSLRQVGGWDPFCSAQFRLAAPRWFGWQHFGMATAVTSNDRVPVYRSRANGAHELKPERHQPEVLKVALARLHSLRHDGGLLDRVEGNEPQVVEMLDVEIHALWFLQYPPRQGVSGNSVIVEAIGRRHVVREVQQLEGMACPCLFVQLSQQQSFVTGQLSDQGGI